MIEAICFLAPIEERSQRLWDYVVTHFPPRQIYVLEGTEKSLRYKTMGHGKLIESMEELPDMPVVVVSPTNAKSYPGFTSLEEYDHPDEACYVFGADDRDLKAEHFGDCSPDAFVFIPTATDDQMYAPMAYAVVAWDRIRGESNYG